MNPTESRSRQAKSAVSFRGQQNSGGMLQRKCACGNHTIAGGECTDCKKKKEGGLQRFPASSGPLTVNHPRDFQEAEAEAIADRVMRSAEPPSSGPLIGARRAALQRESKEESEMETAPPSVEEVLRSPGSHLDPSVRAFMEPRFGRDFSNVRVHTGNSAAQSAREVNAQAYTVRNHLVFDQGRYAPATSTGRRLIAHELAHVVQQSGSATTLVARQENDDAQTTSTLKHAAGVAAGVLTPAEFRMLKCVIREGGCPQSRDGGKPESTDIKTYNDTCKAETGYSGDKLIEPTEDQCRDLKPGALEVLAPSRMQELQSLLSEYAAVVAAGGLSADEKSSADDAIKSAEQKLGSLRPPGEADKQPAPDSVPYAVAAPAGKRLMKPSDLALAGGIGAVGLTFSSVAAGTGRTLAAGAAAGATAKLLIPALVIIGLVVIAYVINDYLVRKEGAGAVETLIGFFISLFRALNDAEIERRIREKPKEKEKPKNKPDPKPDGPGPFPIPKQPEDKEKKGDRCFETMGLRPRQPNARWRVQRPPITDKTGKPQITVLSAAFRLDGGIDPPAGEDTNDTVRAWARSIGKPADDAGHVIANRFGGTVAFNGPNGNIFPQDLSFNRGTMRVLDGLAAQKHDEGCDVCVHLGLDYEATELRPGRVIYTLMYRSPGSADFNPPITTQVPNP